MTTTTSSTTSTTSLATAEAQKVLAIAGMAVAALATFGQAAQQILGNRADLAKALPLLEGLKAVIDALQQGLTGAVTPESVDAAIKELADTLASNNQAVDAAIDQRFGNGSSTP